MIPLECEIGIGKFINKENGLKIVIVWEKRFKGAVQLSFGMMEVL